MAMTPQSPQTYDQRGGTGPGGKRAATVVVFVLFLAIAVILLTRWIFTHYPIRS